MCLCGTHSQSSTLDKDRPILAEVSYQGSLCSDDLENFEFRKFLRKADIDIDIDIDGSQPLRIDIWIGMLSSFFIEVKTLISIE